MPLAFEEKELIIIDKTCEAASLEASRVRQVSNSHQIFKINN